MPSPFDMINDIPPTFNELKVFGWICFVSILSIHRTKLDYKAHKCLFVGFKPKIKDYVLFDLNTCDTFTSRNVIFYECIFPILL